MKQNDKITITSARGLSVTLPLSEYADLIAARGEPVAKQTLLSEAGRALKHRRALAEYYSQELTEVDHALITQIVRALRRQQAIYAAAHELGYGNYIARVETGRPVNEDQWERIMQRSRERANYSDDPTPATADEIAFAIERMGRLSDRDAQYSRRHLMPTWEITAPDGWDMLPAATPVALV